jgi:hypothetical protein
MLNVMLKMFLSVANKPFMLNVIMMNVIMLNVIMLRVIVLNVMAPCLLVNLLVGQSASRPFLQVFIIGATPKARGNKTSFDIGRTAILLQILAIADITHHLHRRHRTRCL